MTIPVSLLNLRPHNALSRRTFLAQTTLIGGAAALVACSAKRAPRYQAWLFVASAAERGIVVSDLASFHRAATIPLNAAPNQVLSANGKVFAVCNEDQTVSAIDPAKHTVSARISAGGRIVAAALTDQGKYLAVALSQPASLVVIDTGSNKIVQRTALSGTPSAIAASETQAALVLEVTGTGKKTAAATIARVSIPSGQLLGVSAVDAGPLTAIDYRRDNQTIFVAAPDAREIISLNAETGAVLARLPVPIRPARFCVDGTGGQVFVTGADHEAQLVIFSPYQNQIDQTMYAGQAPYGMAVAPSRNELFLSNPDAGDVAIMDIDTRRIIASIRTGGKPREILIAALPGASPTDEEYAFVVDGDTGAVTVIHIPSVLHRHGDALIAEAPKPIFAVFNAGAEPQSAVIVPYAA